MEQTELTNGMFVMKELLVSFLTTFSMMLLGILLFRIPLKGKLKWVLIASIVTSNCSFLIRNLLEWDSIQPLLIVLLLALQLYYILRVGRLQAMIISFMGCFCYTILFAGVLFAYGHLLRMDFETLFFNDDAEDFIKLGTVVLCGVTSYLLAKFRWGFTFIAGYDEPKHYWNRQRKLSLVLLASFFLFSIAYYVVSQKAGYLFWIALNFCILLILILYLLYKKEMDEP